MLFKRIEIDAGNNIDTHFIMAHLTTAGACSLGLCLCPLPPRGHSRYCSLRDPVSIQPYPTVPMTSPSVIPLCSESQILILIKSCRALHDLPPMASWPHSLPLPSPPIHPFIFNHPGPSCCSNTTVTFLLQPLLKPSLSQKVSLTLQRKITASFLRITL